MRDLAIPVFFEEKSASSTQYGNIIQGIRSAASRSGMRLLPIGDKALDRTDFSTLAPAAIVTGASMPLIHSIIVRLRKSGRHAVLAGTDSEQFGHDVSCATPSRRTETQQLVNYLYSCGKERIALVGFGQTSVNDTFRLHAAISAAAAWGKLLTQDDVWQWYHDPSESFLPFIASAKRYDAVICPNDVMAICFIDTCGLHGLHVPDDLYVASFGNMAIGRFYSPSITSMTMDMLYVGEQAFHVWRFLINNDDAPQKALKITVPSRILVRESTAGQHIEAGQGAVAPTLPADRFYDNPTIAVLVGIEHCISQRDDIDMHIIKRLMQGHSYEEISADLFISSSTLRYRLNKIYADAGVSRRHAFEALLRRHLGSGNPFASVE